MSGLAWSVVAGAAAFYWYAHLGVARWSAAATIAAAVFSHSLLDALVHRPELPLAGANSVKLGLGPWQYMPAALAVEAAIVFAGLLLFVPGSTLLRGKLIALAALSVLILNLRR